MNCGVTGEGKGVGAADGTAAVSTLTDSENPRYVLLLSEWNAKPIPVLLEI
jgi:hypothetical protein